MTMNIPLDYYRTFYYVAKYGSLTKAANALHANQPNVTRTMNKLEQNLSCRLMIRSNRGIVLTAEGRKLFAHVDRAMRQFDDAQKELNGDMQLEQGIITIGASETALNLLLLDVLKQFHYDYPHISLRILNHANPLALRSVEDGEADFAVLTTPHRKHPGFVSVPLLSYQEILVGGKSFTALSFQSLSLHDLESYSMISMSRETLSYQFHGAICLPVMALCTILIRKWQQQTRFCRWSNMNLALLFCQRSWQEKILPMAALCSFICRKKFHAVRLPLCMTAIDRSVRPPGD